VPWNPHAVEPSALQPSIRVDIVLPVYNEAHILPATVRTLEEFLSQTCPCDWRIVIADNGSTDQTPTVMRELMHEYVRVRGLRIENRGRGIALKHAWARSDADIHAYMDVDLSTGLDALGPLLARVSEGYDIAVGSRHVPDAVLQRSLKRDLLSRAYNVLLRRLFHTPITDAQCGFKAVSHRVVTDLVPLVRSDGWFFDTELLLLAEQIGFRTAEVPVRWVEDHDSRVRIIPTVVEYLREVHRLRRVGLRSSEDSMPWPGARVKRSGPPTPPAAGG